MTMRIDLLIPVTFDTFLRGFRSKLSRSRCQSADSHGPAPAPTVQREYGVVNNGFNYIVGVDKICNNVALH